jgi:hypothetical protein
MDNEIREETMVVVGQGALTIGQRGQGLGRAPGGEAALWPLLPPPSGFFNLLAKYNILVFFWNFLIF